MAPKRSSPLDDPPSASSSSSTSSSGAESEEINGREEQEQNKGVAESEEEEEEEESGEEEEEEEEVENKTPPPVQTPTPIATPQPQSSSGSEGSDSEEDSGGTQTSPTASDFAVKPIIPKPMDDSSTKHNKPTLKSPKSGAKRPAESEEKRKESQQKKKQKVAANGDEKGGVIEEKKSAINRLWSEEDEIVVLKGMIDFQKKKGPISHADMGAFLDFIKKSLHVDVSKNQLVEKVRRLKKKYWSGAVKGEEPVFSKPHDIKCLELAKKIWGGVGSSNNAFVEGVKSNSRNARKSVKVSNSPKEEEQQLALQKDLNGEVKEGLNGEVKEGLNGEVKGIKVEQEDFYSMFPCLHESLTLEGYGNLSEAGRNFIKGSISMIGSVKAKELEEKWKKFREDEVALCLQQIELIQEQTKLIFEAMKSSNS